jgi:hypothetical protein
MNPLPWANSVHPEFKVAQFMAQEARPQQPSPAPSWSSEVNPWMVTFCINEAKKSGAQEKMEELKQKIDKAEKTGNWLALSAYHEDFNLVQSALSAAEVAQMETMNKLRRDIGFTQKLLESWHETKNQFEDAISTRFSEKLLSMRKRRRRRQLSSRKGWKKLRDTLKSSGQIPISVMLRLLRCLRTKPRKLRLKKILSLLRAASSKKRRLRRLLRRARQLTESISITE